MTVSRYSFSQAKSRRQRIAITNKKVKSRTNFSIVRGAVPPGAQDDGGAAFIHLVLALCNCPDSCILPILRESQIVFIA